jgi:hypothetical protein
MRFTSLASWTGLVTSTDLSNVLPRLASENEARTPMLAHLPPIATSFSIASLRQGVGIEFVRVSHGAREVENTFSGDKD